MRPTQTIVQQGVEAQTVEDLLQRSSREFIIMAGKDGVGKSSSLVSMAALIEQVEPDATFYILDFENKIRSVIAAYGDEAPKNIRYYQLTTMNEATETLAAIFKVKKPGDWIAVESMGRAWEKAQDMGYQAVAGLDKAAYLERKRATGSKTVIPTPDEFWSVVKGAHDTEFLEKLAQDGTVNVFLSTTLARPRKGDGPIKESQARKDVRNEFGIDMGIEGAPRLPYYAETLMILDRQDGVVSGRILRDNLSVLDVPTIEFATSDRKSFAMDFYRACRPEF